MTVVSENDVEVHVPVWVRDFDSFVTWMHSDDFPDDARIHFLNGDVWVDLHMEQLFSHNFVKSEITTALGSLSRRTESGFYVSGGMRLTNAEAGFATNPDGMFVSAATYAAKRVELRSGRKGKATELRGTPDLVIEIVSPSSEDKDTAWLMSAYHDAGIPEYWLIDAREPKPRLYVHRSVTKGYVAVRRSGGWVKSPTFGKSVRLTREQVGEGLPKFELEVK